MVRPAARQAVALALLLGCVPPAAADARSPRHIVYDYAVTSYCGLLTPEVEYGFQQELAAVTEESGLTPEAAKASRRGVISFSLPMQPMSP